jgi:hypothetical protein
MKHVSSSHHQTLTMLQNLRTRKLQLDKTIRELEAYATSSGIIVPSEQPRRPYIVSFPDEAQEKWLQ